MAATPHSEAAGVLLVDKPRGQTAFSLVAKLRRHLGVRKIGHAGTLDPFATGVMVMLVGRQYTKLSDSLLCADKEYLAEATLGIATDTYDCEGAITSQSTLVPTREQIDAALQSFQGNITQIPPMFSAKKVNGKKLYELARKGKTIERQPVNVHVHMTVLEYAYPLLTFKVVCSKGTYVRSLAHDLGITIGCGAHLTQLKRMRSGTFHLEDCIDGKLLDSNEVDRACLTDALRRSK